MGNLNKILVSEPERKNNIAHLRDINSDGRLILKWDAKVWSAFSFLRFGSSCGLPGTF
jgi:hypothetical protein